MFCKKCGCRIPASSSQCPECGTERPVTEYCAGFWAELNQNTCRNDKAMGDGVPGIRPGAKIQEQDFVVDYKVLARRPEPTILQVKEPTKPQKQEPAVDRGIIPQKGSPLLIIEALAILALLICSVTLRSALKSKNARIGELEQELERTETELLQAIEEIRSLEMSGETIQSQTGELPDEGGGSPPDELPESGETVQLPEDTSTGASAQEAEQPADKNTIQTTTDAAAGAGAQEADQSASENTIQPSANDAAGADTREADHSVEIPSSTSDDVSERTKPQTSGLFPAERPIY